MLTIFAGQQSVVRAEFNHADALVGRPVFRGCGFDGRHLVGIGVDQSYFGRILPDFLFLVDDLCKGLVTTFSALMLGLEQSISPISCQVSPLRSLIFSSNDPIARKRELCEN